METLIQELEILIRVLEKVSREWKFNSAVDTLITGFLLLIIHSAPSSVPKIILTFCA